MSTKHPLAHGAAKFFLVAFLVLLVTSQASGSSPAASPGYATRWQDLPPEIQAKVDPRILAELAGEIVPTHLQDPTTTEVAPFPKKPLPPPTTRFLVFLKTQADLELLSAGVYASTEERRATVVDALLATAQSTQAPVKTMLDQHRARGTVTGYISFYVFNGFAVEGNLDTVIELALREDVERLSANYRLVRAEALDEGPNGAVQDVDGTPQSIDPANWNIGLVGAERVWDELGIRGEDVVVASFDSGVDWDHPALRAQYRGTGDSQVDHNYNWFEFDPSAPEYWDPDGDYGPSLSNAPSAACGSHGTHTAGTIVGDGGTPGTQIGMAPGARWIAVPGICSRGTMPGGYEDDIGGIRTFQWLMCPTDLSGELATRDCSKAPDVINNSWGSSNPADLTFQSIIRALRAAGIVPVFAAGNPGSGPGSIGSPASVPEAIAVSATDSADQVAPFGGRGPSVYEGVQKPELTAPGVSIWSCVPGTGYDEKSGTSMAAPHVSGLAALMISADLQDGYRDLSVDELLRVMTLTAVDLGATGPDNDYGYGRIDAFAAVHWVLNAGIAEITVRNINTGAPIPDATVVLAPVGQDPRYTGQTDEDGDYAFSVPSGAYDVQIEAFGYAVHDEGPITVEAGVQTPIDVELIPLGAGTLTGQVHSDGMPVPGARLYVDGVVGQETYSAADGSYDLRLPVGSHSITVKVLGYRMAHATVEIQAGVLERSFDLTPAPTILLVEADGYRGWFWGRPVRQFFQWPLDDHDYVYNTVTITDTALLPEIADYDLVIWAHTVGSPGIADYGSNGVLQDYLDGGGRLILSGQDIGYWDQWDGQDIEFYREYLHARLYEPEAALERDTVSGSHFLSGIRLALNEAAQYSYPNSMARFSPDGVQALDGNAYPILTYDNGNGAAALAIDPCDNPYRVVYMSVGYENLGPRAASRPPEYAELMDRAIQWVVESKPTHDVSLSVIPAQHIGVPGATVSYDVIVANTGLVPDIYDLTLSGHQWPTRLLDEGTQEPYTADIPPCGSLGWTIEVDIPPLANPDDQDVFAIEATSQSSPSVHDRVEGTTTALSIWQSMAPMPTPRYRLAAASLPNAIEYYAIGGFTGPTWETPLAANERYDTCSNQWTEMAPMPTARGNSAAAAIGTKIYVAGGFADGTRLDVLEVYDVASNTWMQRSSLPEPLSGAAAAAWDGKLYLFGGNQEGTGVSDKTYVYDPLTDQWLQKAPMPGGARAFAAAATLDNRIYVAGGWYTSRVEVYDPTTDTWTQAAPLIFARQSLGMTAAPDGRLYVAGGGDDWRTGFRTAERYEPAEDRWQLLDSLTEGNRIGTVVAYADGRIYCTGGVGGLDDRLSVLHESLRLAHSFCHSTIHAESESGDLARPGDTISYTVELHSSMTALEGATVLNPIPEGTTFASFGANPVGATYNAGQNRVEWTGTLAGNAPPQRFSYAVRVDQAGWEHGDQIVNLAQFDNGAGQQFTRAATVAVDFADPHPSTKQVSHELAPAGAVLTYTLHIENSSMVTDTFSLTDPLPPHTTFLPESLTYTAGQGLYDPAQGVVSWSGVLPVNEGYTVGGYLWGDSMGGGTVPDVSYAWQDMGNATDTNVDADDHMFGPFPIGFTFDFYGTQYDEFYVSPNGWVGFEYSTGLGIVSCSGYGSALRPNTFIGGFGKDRAVYSADGGAIVYRVFGDAPDRILVVQFTRMRYHYTAPDDLADMQILMYEGSNKIQVQYRNLTTSPTSSHTGVEGPGSDYSFMLYQDQCPSMVSNGLAIVFEPILVPHYRRSAELSFAVTTNETIPAHTWITNTALLSSSITAVERSARTLVNPVDLSSSTKTVDRLYAVPGDTITYELHLNNTGSLPAQGVTLVDPIPEHTVYVPGSVVCSDGSCSYAEQEDEIRWSGEIADGDQVSVRFSVTLSAIDQRAVPIANEALLRDATGHEHRLQAVFVARTSDLSMSRKEANPDHVDYGEVFTFTVLIQNAGAVGTTAELSDRLPDGLSYVPESLRCDSGSCAYADGTITWQGTVPGEATAAVQFQVTAPDDSYPGFWLVNTAVITDTNRGRAYSFEAQTRLGELPGEWMHYLPLVGREP